MSRSHIATTGCVLAITALALTTLPAVAAHWAAGAALALSPLPALTRPRTVGTALAPPPRPPVTPTRKPSAPVVVSPPPGVIEALQRDLGLTREQAEARLLNEARLAPIEAQLREELGDHFGGSWFTGIIAQTLVIATTSAGDVPRIVSAGARAKVVRASLATLRALKQKLDDTLPAHPTSGSVRYVDVQSNKVVILSRYAAATRNIVKSIGVDTSMVVVVASKEDPRPWDLPTTPATSAPRPTPAPAPAGPGR
ncbi:S1 family peptidase [Streptosporangium sp. NBC_01495]|uniref:S1 family peptidase n=1 Tax=Streptosporangium sp. NBC_01495 TaxID=2903899 RepID=UPI002E35AFC6|nr:S1 family peptidase [Streptosporangium sp. NBC_01495]